MNISRTNAFGNVTEVETKGRHHGQRIALAIVFGRTVGTTLVRHSVQVQVRVSRKERGLNRGFLPRFGADYPHVFLTESELKPH